MRTGVPIMGCHIDCDRLLDSDISDDVQCIRTIHEEHTRISGDGFTAWTVYNGHCRQQTKADIVGCFGGTDLSKEQVPPAKGNEITKKAPPQRAKGKIFKRCELAQELYYKHKLPMKEIPTWVCIAEHESSFNTAAVGRLNADGSADHGLFQISDLYWCTHGEGGGKACHIECDRLLDSDISDDVKCIRTIHEEHTRLSGDGFNAWTVYNGHCRHQSLAMLSDCFDGNEITEAQRPRPSPYAERPQVKPQQVIMDKPQQKIAASHGYANNPFLQNIQAVKNPQVSAQQLALFSNSKEKPSTALVPGSSPSTRPNYDHNPFLKAPGSPRPSATPLKNSVQVKPNDNLSYAQNPFLSLLARPIVPARAPVKPSVATKSPQHVTRPYVSSDSFRNEVIKYTATSSEHCQSNCETDEFPPLGMANFRENNDKNQAHNTAPVHNESYNSLYYCNETHVTPNINHSLSGNHSPNDHQHNNKTCYSLYSSNETYDASHVNNTPSHNSSNCAYHPPINNSEISRPATTTRTVPSTRPTASTKTTNHPAPTTRPTITTRRTLTTRSTTRYTATARPTQRPTTRQTTRYSAITTRATRPTTSKTLPSTTPRPYLFTSTTTPQKSSTTADPFSHPFFQKFKAKFEKTPSPVLQIKTPTTTAAPSRQNQSTTSSPYYAKYQENKVKVAAKTVFSYDFGQNRTTTKRPDNPTTKIASRAPKSAFDVYLNWNKN
ncbi:mediator of DNA damage checkpoint protein 1 [Drosophila persimilis]|uniref:mediator of DNA damage checkpoint protein 1 n=1 Tax=Drosophila persimilis TaxID=7234 RepID=UPI000F09795D|nr:mediator of DNA damage checkpoint protein 1 [Drosophila persimilis]